jgi:prevent-host-death family protein
MDREPNIWSAQDAKAKFSEVLDKVEDGKEQVITRHGKKVARLIPYSSDEAMEGETAASLVALLDASPLRGSGLKLKRSGKVALKPRRYQLW